MRSRSSFSASGASDSTRACSVACARRSRRHAVSSRAIAVASRPAAAPSRVRAVSARVPWVTCRLALVAARARRTSSSSRAAWRSSDGPRSSARAASRSLTSWSLTASAASRSDAVWSAWESVWSASDAPWSSSAADRSASSASSRAARSVQRPSALPESLPFTACLRNTSLVTSMPSPMGHLPPCHTGHATPPPAPTGISTLVRGLLLRFVMTVGGRGDVEAVQRPRAA